MQKPEALKDRRQGALYGLLIGDAAGVPYEFKPAERIPTGAPLLDLTLPPGVNRSHGVPFGTWSDDGAQALCLLASLQEKGVYDAEDFTQRLIRWMNSGYMAVDDDVFDIGIQTRYALTNQQLKKPVADDERSNGNGSLMRCLPAALYFRNPLVAASVAMLQSKPTHPHMRSQLCCAFYTLLVHELLWNDDKRAAFDTALGAFEKFFAEYADELKIVLAGQHEEKTGSGYVVNCLWSAIHAFMAGNSYHEVLQYAIMFGEDTDTTAAVAGGLAGAFYGLSGIPPEMLNALRGRDLCDPLIIALV